MKRILTLLLLGAFPTLLAETGMGEQSPSCEGAASVNPAGPVPTEARRLALETAGAFVNDGFRVRDGEWAVSLTKESPRFLQVTLFAGNRYWFVAATPTAGARMRVTVYDESGRPLKGELWQDQGASGGGGGFRIAAGVAPERSGKYVVGVELLESSKDAQSDASLVYAFK